MTKKKRRAIIIAGAVALAAVLAVAVYAFVGRTTSADTRNTITTGGVRIELNETKDNGTPFTDVSGVLPGQSYEKNVSVTNTGAQTAWVRVKVEKVFLNAAGAKFDGDPTAVILEELDTDGWLDGNNGYYYYKTPLDGGAETTKLFTGVQFDGAKIDSTYAGGDIKVNVTAEAVQYRNNESNNDVTQVQGWPET